MMMTPTQLGSLIGITAKDAMAAPSMSMGQLQRLVQNDELAEAALGIRRADPNRPYGRQVVFAENALEAMVATWTPGFPSAPHDHGGSLGAVRVLRGKALHTLWKVTDGNLEIIHEHEAGVGDVLSCGPDLIHSVADAACPSGEPLQTLHMYTEAIDHMLVYDLQEERTLMVDGGCGAWVPHDQPELIRDIFDGYVGRAELALTFKDNVLERLV